MRFVLSKWRANESYPLRILRYKADLQTARRLWAKILTIVTAATVSRLSHLARYTNSLTFTGRLLAIPPAQLAGKRMEGGAPLSIFVSVSCRAGGFAQRADGGGLLCGGEGEIRLAGVGV